MGWRVCGGTGWAADEYTTSANGFKEKHKMKLHKCIERVLFMSLVVMILLIAGCVVVQTDEHYTGVDNKMLKEVKCGQTTKDWIVATFGEPSEQSMTDRGTEILRYKCTRKKDNQFVMFPPPIVIKDDGQAVHVVAFEVKDGIVKRYWKET
jgi:hypothetical protein